jgi:hypothetical protein
MKKFLLLILLLILSVCIYPQFSDEMGTSSNMGDGTKVIWNGFHFCIPPAFGKKWKFNNPNRRFKFRVHMSKNCSYTSNDLNSTGGWNKIGRISFVKNTNFNKFKMHLGWIFHDDPHKIDLALFYHNNNEKVFVAHKIDARIFDDLNATVDMYLGETVIGMIINDEYNENYDIKCIGIRQDNTKLTGSQDSFVAKTFYFGGNSTAPHAMNIKLHDLWVDRPGFQTEFNNCDIMTWNLSEFTSNDYFSYYARKEIHGSTKNKNDVHCHANHPNEEYQKCLIKEGARIEFTSGYMVHLHPGFHAEKGSYFHAKTKESNIYTK